MAKNKHRLQKIIRYASITVVAISIISAALSSITLNKFESGYADVLFEECQQHPKDSLAYSRCTKIIEKYQINAKREVNIFGSVAIILPTLFFSGVWFYRFLSSSQLKKI